MSGRGAAADGTISILARRENLRASRELNDKHTLIPRGRPSRLGEK